MATATKKQTNLQPAIKELHKIYDKANKVLFNNELPDIVITMQSRGNRKGVLGWFVTKPIWETGENEELYEINICTEALNRDYFEIITTLIHEMIHVECAVKGIKETSRNGSYHNKKFKQQAELHGMEYTHEKPDSKIGFSAITLTEETVNKIKFWGINTKAFSVSRKELGAGAGAKKKSNIRKYVCGCGTIIRASKEVNVICGDCGTKFEEEA